MKRDVADGSEPTVELRHALDGDDGAVGPYGSGRLTHRERPETRPARNDDLLRAGVRSRDRMRGGRLLVEGRRLFRRLEDVGVVTVEDARALAVADEPELLVAVVHRARAPRAGDGRDQVLVEALLQVHHVAGQDHRS